ncbi:MAG: hypothetical protein ABFC84_13635 [Veillonellales bacterium]
MYPKWDDHNYKAGCWHKDGYPYMHPMHPMYDDCGDHHEMDCMPKMEPDCCPPMPCEMPKMKCKPKKECVKTFKCCYKLYRITSYRLYKICSRCGCEFDHHMHQGMCPKCGIAE